MASSVRLCDELRLVRLRSSFLRSNIDSKPSTLVSTHYKFRTFSTRRAKTMEIDEATLLKRQCEKQAIKEAGLVKRKVALFVGYIGTAYSGLQLSNQDHVQTIEAELQSALLKSGCVTESNSESLSKVKWSRSSRTDKGVHSLATAHLPFFLVVENNVLDPEGLELANRISVALPPEIRVFSVQRVNDGFFARKACISRTYNYYVPMFLLNGTEEPVDETVEHERLKRFRKALALFCGRHAFHNYTKRKQYIDNPDTTVSARRNRQKRRVNDSEGFEEDDSDEDDPQTQNRMSYPDFHALVEMEKETGRWRFWNYAFKEFDDPSDRIVGRHYRNVYSFTANDPAPLIEGGIRAIRCQIHGQSFMLHQIRYMIGAAIAFTRGLIGFQILESSLKACIRINLPLALPQPLILTDNTFSEFPSNRGEPAVVSRWSGMRLALKSGGRGLQKVFEEEKMMPEIDRLLNLPDWARWSEILELIRYDEDNPEVQTVLQQYQEWIAEKIEIKEAKKTSLQEELDERGIDHETWRQEKRERSRRTRQRNKSSKADW